VTRGVGGVDELAVRVRRDEHAVRDRGGRGDERIVADERSRYLRWVGRSMVVAVMAGSPYERPLGRVHEIAEVRDDVERPRAVLADLFCERPHRRMNDGRCGLSLFAS
jgi:hypothetical protein